MTIECLSEEERAGVYKAIYNRRDIRSFNKKEVSEALLYKLLDAAHQAPSVGFMQPWDFVVVREEKTKEALANIVDRERRALAIHFEASGRDTEYMGIKIAGILEAPITICITCDPSRGGDHVLGRNSIPETDIMSVSCAIQNMWLAAYAEGLAMGWVSFYKKADVRRILKMPPHIDPTALISIGYTDDYPEKPLLEIINWEKRRALTGLIHENTWSS